MKYFGKKKAVVIVSIAIVGVQILIFSLFLYNIFQILPAKRFKDIGAPESENIVRYTVLHELFSSAEIHQCDIMKESRQNKTFLIQNYIQKYTSNGGDNFTSESGIKPDFNEKKEDHHSGNQILTWLYPPGRLGNRLFSYASFLGTAIDKNMEPQLFGKNCGLFADVFQSHGIVCNETLGGNSGGIIRYVAAGVASYDHCVNAITNMPTGRVIALAGYMQSWKYFHKYRTKVLEHFTFLPSVMHETKHLFKEKVLDMNHVKGKYINLKDIILVGVHVRRTDMATPSNKKKGFAAAPIGYIHRAIGKMETIISENNRTLIYVIVSDDIKWCIKNIRDDNRYIIYYSGTSSAVDLAMLSLCNHTIITSGTFGWWGAYLAKGHTIYYSGYPRPGSALANVTKTEDYYLQRWIGIN